VLLLSSTVSSHHFGPPVNRETILAVSDFADSKETVLQSVSLKELDFTHWQLGEYKLISWLRRQNASLCASESCAGFAIQ
jgi:hypothetical protein